MSILKNFLSIFKSRDKPQNRTPGSAFSFVFGSTTAGKNVSERSAMQITAVYACVRILAESVASLPLHLYKYDSLHPHLPLWLRTAEGKC